MITPMRPCSNVCSSLARSKLKWSDENFYTLPHMCSPASIFIQILSLPTFHNRWVVLVSTPDLGRDHILSTSASISPSLWVIAISFQTCWFHMPPSNCPIAFHASISCLFSLRFVPIISPKWLLMLPFPDLPEVFYLVHHSPLLIFFPHRASRRIPSPLFPSSSFHLSPSLCLFFISWC